jgi:hypothetical protein
MPITTTEVSKAVVITVAKSQSFLAGWSIWQLSWR